MCKCLNVEIGTYKNQVSLYVPEENHTMSEYMNNRRKVGLSKGRLICVDRCLMNEIIYLWKKGIRTTGCCCGHNKLLGFIGVFEEDIQKMKDLGYKVAYNPSRPDDEDSFEPKSLEEQ